MFRLIDRLRRRLRGESGMTLVELMIAMGLLGVVIMALLGTLASVQRRVGRETRPDAGCRVRVRPLHQPRQVVPVGLGAQILAARLGAGHDDPIERGVP